MRIYPKKYQSGGTLSDVGYYPSAQYIPTSSVAITQGAWQPLNYAKTADSVIDPDLINKVKGHSNDGKDYFNRINQETIVYNNMSEAERRSVHGRNQLAKIREATAELNSLANYKETTLNAMKQAKEQKSFNNLATDTEGRAIVKYVENGKERIGLVDKIIAANDPKFTWINNAEAAALRDTHDDLIRQDISAGLVGSVGKEIYDKNLYDSLQKIGHNEIKRQLEGMYGVQHADGLIKSMTTYTRHFTNNDQIAAAAKIAETHMSQQDRNGIESDAYLALKNNNDTLKVLVQTGTNSKHEPIFDIKPISIPEYRKDLEKLRKEAEKTGDYSKVAEATGAFVNLYKKAYLQSFFDARRENEFDSKQDYKVLGADLAKDFGGGKYQYMLNHDAVAAVGAYDTQKQINQFNVGNGIVELQKETVSPMFVDPNNPKSSNIIATEKGAIFNSPITRDAKVQNYTKQGRQYIGGLPTNKFNRDELEHTYRLGTNEDFRDTWVYKNVDGTTSVINNATSKSIVEKINKIYSDAKTELPQNQGAFLKKELAKINVVPARVASFEAVVLLDKSKQSGKVGSDMTSRGDFKYKDSSNNPRIDLQQLETLRRTLENQYKTEKDGKEVSINAEDGTVVISSKSGYRKVFQIAVTKVQGFLEDPSKILATAKDEFGQNFHIKSPFDLRSPDLYVNKNIKEVDDILRTTQPFVTVTREEGGIIPQFTPKEFEIKPLSLNDLY